MNSLSEQKGYTLVEALIAVAILAAIAGALAPVTHTAIKAAARINSDARRAEAVRVGEGALSEIFASMIVPGNSETKPAFKGARDRIDLFILIDQEQGPQAITLEVRDGLLLYTPPAQDGAGLNKSSGVRLAENVEAFRYLGATEDGDSPRWRNVWEEQAPPLLVEIDYAKSATAPRTARSFTLSNRAPLHCAFDQVSRQCRD